MFAPISERLASSCSKNGIRAAPTDTNTAPAPDAGVAPAASINTETLEKNLIKIFGKDILIENKEDFVKLIKAAEEYNKSLTEKKEDNKKETINEEVLWEELVNKTIKNYFINYYSTLKNDIIKRMEGVILMHYEEN